MYTSTAEKIGLDTMKILVYLGFGSEDLKDMQLSYTRFFFILSPASVYDRILSTLLVCGTWIFLKSCSKILQPKRVPVLAA